MEKSVNAFALRVKHWLEARKITKMLSLCSADAPQCLDIGCGDGRLLDRLAEQGVPPENLYGVELSPKVVDELDRKGYHGYEGRVEELSLPANHFDLILTCQVIEHVSDPAEMFQAVNRILAPGGIFIVETPNTDCLDARIFRKRYWGGYHFPRHWNLFNRKSIARLGKDSGLETVTVETFVCAVFWIYPFHHWLREHHAPRKIYRLFWPSVNVPLLAFFTLVDIVLAPLGLAGNLRGVFKRPEV